MSDTSDAPLDISGHTVAVSGATGLVGTALGNALIGQRARMVALTRHAPIDPQSEVQWNPDIGVIEPARLEGVAAVVHLAGDNIAQGRWTAAKKQRIRDSRVIGTRSLCQSLAQLREKPAVLVCASAIGYYGDRGDEELTEASAAGTGFLPEVCAEWERACDPAREVGIRVVNVRIGVIISRHGGALAAMLTPFKLGLGGKVGSGQQYWSWVSLADVVGTILESIRNPLLRGPVNAVSPQPVSNLTFTKTLGAVLHRPTIFPMPAFAARLALGEMANDLLLASTRVTPQRLNEVGYRFQHPDLRECLADALR
jgi:uncharacterized protein (TIGR01777 family)